MPTLFRSPRLLSGLLTGATCFSTLALLPWTSVAQAQDASSEGVLSLALAAPDRVLTAADTSDEVVLSRKPEAKKLRIITKGTTTPKYLARKYGVALSAVKVVEKGKGLRVMELRLPGRVQARPPIRPKSVVTYRVRNGDTLAGVAARFGLNVVDLLGTNLNRRSLDHLSAGETLNVPTGERGLLVRIKPGQSAMSLIAGYKADLVEVAKANDVLPTELQVGDEVLLPGIRAEKFEKQLEARREAERLAAIAYQKQLRYERYLAWKKQQVRLRLEAKYRTQEQYERYLAWMKSPERQRQIEAYERQLQFEREQAAARVRARQAAQEAAAARARAAAEALAAQRARAAAQVRAASISRPNNANNTVRAAQSAQSSSIPRRDTGGLSWPMRNFRLSSYYGSRDIAYHRAVFHGGIDLAAPYGTPIYAAASGYVSQSGWGYYGINVITQSGNRTLVYGHMSRTAVRGGQYVARGQLIGYVGCSGICTGPHLHFEVRVGGRAINPLAVLP